MNKSFRQKLLNIITYHSNNSTSGYLLDDKRIGQIIDLMTQELAKQEKRVREKWTTFFREDIESSFIPKCRWCGKIATKQTAKGEDSQKNNCRPCNWGYYCKKCYAKGINIEEEAMYGN